jgi:hypothetical protein
MSLKILLIILIVIGLLFNYFVKDKETFSAGIYNTINIDGQVMTNNKNEPTGNIDIDGRLISDKLCFNSSKNTNNQGEISTLDNNKTDLFKVNNYFKPWDINLKNIKITNKNILTNNLGSKPNVYITSNYNGTVLTANISGGSNFKKDEVIFIVYERTNKEKRICFFTVGSIDNLGGITGLQNNTFNINEVKNNLPYTNIYNTGRVSDWFEEGIYNTKNGYNPYLFTSNTGLHPEMDIYFKNTHIEFKFHGGSQFKPGDQIIFYDWTLQNISLFKILKTRVCITKNNIKTIKDAPHFDPKSVRINNTELLESDFNNLLIIDDIIKSDYIIPSKKNMHMALPRTHKERNFWQWGAAGGWWDDILFKSGNIGTDAEGNRLVGEARNDPAEYHCSGEHGLCKCPKNGHIKYIDWHHNRWTRKVAHPSGETRCNNSYFGDPSWGHYKHCYCTPGVPKDPKKTNIRLYQMVRS